MRASFLLVLFSLNGISCGGQAVSAQEEPHDAGDGDASAVADAADARDAPDTSLPPDAADAADAPPDEPPAWDHVTTCPSGMGPAMVLLPAGFCIDSTEVTRGQYRAWLQTNPSLAGQHERCSAWNESFVPVDWCEQSSSFGCTQEACPQTCLDWCDAYAFCQAVGKHLCGRMGGGGLASWSDSQPSDATDPSLSQWYHACSANGQNTYPYGDTYEKNACNGESATVTQLPVGSKPDCQSSTPGYAGIFDLSGNVEELEDNCTEAGAVEGDKLDGSDDTCSRRGGYAAISLTAEDYACTAVGFGRRSTVNLFGFRCCFP